MERNASLPRQSRTQTKTNIAVSFRLSARKVLIKPADFGLRQLTYQAQKLVSSPTFEVYF